MPPFKDGLLKRKLNSTVSKTEKIVSQSPEDEESEPEELFRGVIEAASDEDDSEPETGADSDHERDEVLYDDDADSTLGDEDSGEHESDASSDLTDSEGDDEKSNENGSDDEGTEYSDNSTDSGAESGSGPTQSSDEVDRKTKNTLPEVKQKHRKNAKSTDKSKGKPQSSVDRLAEETRATNIETQPVEQKDEYSSGDSSDEEDRRTTLGAVPRHWYQEYPHLGYDQEGRRLLKPPPADLLDEFLRRCEDPHFWRTVRDPDTGQDVRLGAEELRLLQRLRRGMLPDERHDEYAPWLDWFSREVLATPLRAFPEHKRSFLPSRDEQRRVAKLVHALKMGWAKTRKQIQEERRRRRQKAFYDLWGSAADSRGVQRHIAAPRRPPPSHAESYNPPPEFLLDARERREWDALATAPWKRKHNVLPQRFAALRAVPAYDRFVRERFLRCLDLYLAPRAIKMRLTISPEDLVPKLPSPRELQPFPTQESLTLRGHTALVRSVDFDPSGEFIVTGSDDGTVKVWETSTGRCLRTAALGGGEGVAAVAWCPAPALEAVAAAAGARLLLWAAAAGERAARAERLLREPPALRAQLDERTAAAARWEAVSQEEWARGVRLAVTHFRPVTHVSWHARGDYVCVTLRDAASRSVLVHQLSRRASQLPLRRAPGLVQCAAFHPVRPQLFVATQRVVRVYDLVKQQLVRKLQTGAQWVSALALHPGGDNLLVASYDRKCVWFDLELSARPYQTLRLHGSAVRAAAFSPRYPLFATGGDDAHLVVSHGQVYADLLRNPLLVPLRRLPTGKASKASKASKAGKADAGPNVLALRWHPAQPWLLAGCADGTARLYT